MATERQLEANRANAQKSTGPRTADGKSKSAQNSLRHGLAARGLIILPGHESAFTELEAGYRESLQPFGSLQEAIFQRIVESAWNIRRCALAEVQLYSQAADPTIDPLLDDQNEAKYARIHKYAHQNETALYKALRELGALQTEKQYRHQAYPLTQEQHNDVEEFEKTPHSLSEVCGFAKVIATVNRQMDAETNRRTKELTAVRHSLIAKIKQIGTVNQIEDETGDEIQNEPNHPQEVEVAAAA
jgi:hypothetical protein